MRPRRAFPKRYWVQWLKMQHKTCDRAHCSYHFACRIKTPSMLALWHVLLNLKSPLGRILCLGARLSCTVSWRNEAEHELRWEWMFNALFFKFKLKLKRQATIHHQQGNFYKRLLSNANSRSKRQHFSRSFFSITMEAKIIRNLEIALIYSYE